MPTQGATSLSPRRAVLSFVVLAGLGLSACSGEPDPVTDRDAILRLTLTEYRIEPQVVRVRPGRVRIIATNEGTLPHNIRVRSLDRERGEEVEEFGDFPGTAFPGGRVRGEATLPPGKFELVCTIGNHDELGQTGTLIVGDGS